MMDMKSASQGSESDRPLCSPIQAEGGIFCKSRQSFYSLLLKSVAEHATCRAYQLLWSTQSLLCKAPISSLKFAYCRREFSHVNVQCDINMP